VTGVQTCALPILYGTAAMDFECSAGSGRFALVDKSNTPYFELNQRTTIDVNEDYPTTPLTLENSSTHASAEVALAFKCGATTSNIEFDGSRFKIYDHIIPENNSVNLGENNITSCFGDIYANEFIDVISDRRVKQNIQDCDLGLDFIGTLRPRRYQKVNGTSGRYHYGLISQEVEELMDDQGISSLDFAGLIKTPKKEDETDYNYALRYGEFTAPMIKSIQELKQMVEAQANLIAAQQAQIDSLQNQLNDLIG